MHEANKAVLRDPAPYGSARAELPALYQAPAARYDELHDAQGKVRPHWQRFVEHWQALGSNELSARWEKAQHLIHENGVSYNVYGDAGGLDRAWSLSLPPTLISPEDWSAVSRGIEQRARLLGALLADIYGPQRMLIEGLLPPEIVFMHASFLRPLHGVRPAHGLSLPMYAADLLRASDGRLHVSDDFTQAPSGAGYALENRIVVSQTLPELFRECNVQRLALFFRSLRDLLGSLAPHNRDNPRIVLLTPGPYNATYFEQAYLAQYLGITLVTGGDLAVRDDRVYLKTLAGLLQVDVILRRVNDDYCDPLELRADSVLGVSGLVQAVRAGNVAIASPLGSGVVQSPAVLPYLPRLCRALLAEDLLLPSVPSLYCGDPISLPEVEARFDDLLIRAAFPEGPTPPIHTATLDSQARAELLERVRETPHRYVAQERMLRSTTAVLEQGTLVPRAAVLRAYSVALASGAHTVMPGGLLRVAADAEGTQTSMQAGAKSQDLWVLSDGPVSTFSLLSPNRGPVRLSRGGADLPSRAADHLYWLGRYSERAEVIARLARVVTAQLSELSSDSDLEKSTEIASLLTALRAQTHLLHAADIPTEAAFSLRASEDALVAAVLDVEHAGSLASVVRHTLRAGRVVRDRISTDTYRVLASLDEDLTDLREELHYDRTTPLHALLNKIILTMAAFSGLAMESMSRGQAWVFLDIGRRLERAIGMVTLLRSTLVAPSEREVAVLDAVLEIADSSMTYRRRYLATLQVAPVLDLLLSDETNPRSVAFQLASLTDHFARLPALETHAGKSNEHRLALAIRYEIELCEVERLCTLDATGRRSSLDALLRKLGTQLPRLSDSLSESYLAHARIARHLSGPAFEPGYQDRDGDPT